MGWLEEEKREVRGLAWEASTTTEEVARNGQDSKDILGENGQGTEGPELAAH